MLAAALLLEGTALSDLTRAFSGERYAPDPLSAAELTVLRRLAGHTLDHPQMPDGVRFEVPQWLLPLFAARFGPELAAELAALLHPAPVDLRVNLLKATREQAQVALAADGIETTTTTHSPWGLRVIGRRPVLASAAFREGLIEIQDEGSQLIAQLVDAKPGARVADLCSGAGGKTLALAMMMQNRGHILACDVSAARLDAATRRLRRAGVHNVERHLLTPGDRTLKRRAASFDHVLVDAPCTGTGTWRRNPAVRHRLIRADLAACQERQCALLETAARLVRKGGQLIYATCSLLIEEDEAHVSAFLAGHPDFALRPSFAGEIMLLTPARHGTDGFFAAVLERRT